MTCFFSSSQYCTMNRVTYQTIEVFLLISPVRQLGLVINFLIFYPFHLSDNVLFFMFFQHCQRQRVLVIDFPILHIELI